MTIDKSIYKLLFHLYHKLALHLRAYGARSLTQCQINLEFLSLARVLYQIIMTFYYFITPN